MEKLKDKICRKFCFFFKENKELPLEEKCGTFRFFYNHQNLLKDLTPSKKINSEINKKIINYFCKPICDYYIKDCDWTNPEIKNKIEPCGGFYFLQELFNKYVILQEEFFIKKLENLFLFDRKRDELYELDENALEFFKNCDGSHKLYEIIKDFETTIYLIENGIIKLSKEKKSKKIKLPNIEIPSPSLRYLEIQLTYSCNLSCKHCYLGNKENIHLDFNLLKRILDEFEELQGLRVLFSGGEPFLYKYIYELLDLLEKYSFRRVFISNGTLIKKDLLKNIDQIQISLDGLEKSHDFIRGKGTFKKILENIELIKSQNIDISIATMIHKKNLNEFDELEKLIKSIGVVEWGIDVPVVEGNLKNHEYLLVTPEEAKYPLSKKFGGSFHEPLSGYACGAHLSTIFPDGKIAKCGFYYNNAYADLNDDFLIEALNNKENLKLNNLECNKIQCKFLEECRGGCRYRAGDELKKDCYMCVLFS